MKLLNAKNWQVFLITYGVQFIAPVITGTSKAEPFVHKVDILLLFVLIASLFCWIWSVAHRLQDFVEPTLRISTALFNVAFTLPIIYLVISAIYYARIGRLPLEEPWIMIPHVLSILCYLYLIGFAAKVIKIAEVGQRVDVSHYFGEVFQIFFFPIGIWFLQPRINGIVKSSRTSNKTN